MTHLDDQLAVLIASETLGHGDDELGAVLMRAFLKTLTQAESLPSKVLLLNGGVKLAVEGSPHLQALAELEARGVQLFSCGTCLDWYGLKEALAVGRPTTMRETVDTLLGSARVIRP